MFRLLVVLPFLILFQIKIDAQTDSLQKDLKQLIADKNAVVGIYIKVIETGETITLNPEYKYPLMSVFKLHLGLTVLHLIDKGVLQLNQEVYINKSDLMENTWSPIRVKYPEGNIKLTVAELLQYTISESDNNGCDILLKLIGVVYCFAKTILPVPAIVLVPNAKVSLRVTVILFAVKLATV